MTTVSKTLVRTAVAQFFGGTTYDNDFRCYRGGPLLGSGLSTVRPYQPKRLPDFDYVNGLTPGRGMGAVMILEMPRTRDTVLTVGTMPAALQGQRHIVYPVRCHFFHMAHMNYAEDAEQDVDNLDEAIHERIWSDPTLGTGTSSPPMIYQAGINSTGIDSIIDPSSVVREITRTHFEVRFDVEVQIVV